MTQDSNQSAPLNHVGVTVTDISRGIDFYTKTLGFRLVVGPLEIVPDDTHFGRLARDILGPRLRHGQFAHLVGSNGAGLELFSFDDIDAGPRDEMEFWRNGFYHIALTVPDIDEMINFISTSGGRRRTATWEIFPGAERFLAYAEDPFGNPIELYTHGYEETWKMAVQKDGPATLIVELKAKVGDAETLLSLTKAVIPKALKEPTAETIELFADPSDDTKICLIERWGSRAYVTSEDHTKAPHMTEYFGAIEPLLAEPPKWAVWDLAENHRTPT